MESITKYTYMSKEQFLKQMELDERCPHEFKLVSIPCLGEGENSNECMICWKNAIKNVEFNNPIVTFEKNAIGILDDLSIMEAQYQMIKAGRENLKQHLLEMMEHYGVSKFDNDKFSISYVKGSTGTTFDSTRFKKENKELYDAYQKESVRAASIRFKVK